ncbi:MAG: AMP-binding protein, partial [Kutzneria sp.]|nr:AMP-binding protein [Kutzneria sp.]
EQHTDEEGGGLVEDPVFLACTTVAHAAGLIVDMTLIGGGTIVLHERFDPSAVLAAIPRHRVTALFLLPPLLYQLVDHPSLDSTDLSSLSRVVYGGCAAAPSRLARAIDRLGPVLFQFYGQSEAGGISMLTEQDHLRPELLSTVGRVMPGVEIAIRDEEGRDLPRGTVGEICVRSAMISGGYWRNPELTAEVWRDGWVHTGDVGHLDDEGYLHLSDRIKDMIIVVGGHVYPTELEDVLLGHPAVAQAAVYGVRDADAVERVHAALVTNPGHRPELAEIQRYVESRLGPMYAPSHIEILDEIPLTDAGKPDKKVLRQRHMGATH